MRHTTLFFVTLFSLSVFCFSQEKSISDLRKQAAKLQKDGNWKDAFQVYESLLLEKADNGQGGADDLNNAWVCLSRMRQSKLVDELLEKVVEKYSEDWRVLVSAARVYNQIPKWGMIIDDEFVRESRSGGGRQVNTRERDRVKSLSLMEQALKVSVNEEEKKALGAFYFEFAAAIGRGGNEAWRLQDLTNLDELPDYHEGVTTVQEIWEHLSMPMGPQCIMKFLPVGKTPKMTVRDGGFFLQRLQKLIQLEWRKQNTNG